MSQVIACVDGSASTPAVCDYAAWASQALSAPLVLLNVVDKQLYPSHPDLSGHLGWGTQEHLLEELASLDEKRARLAISQGQSVLESACERVKAQGLAEVDTRQRHGEIVETLAELHEDTRLLVIGRQGNQPNAHPVGSHVESVLRTQHRPVLVTTAEFRPPRSLLIAYDASPTLEKSLQMLSRSPLFSGVKLHLLHVGAHNGALTQQMQEASEQLAQAGFEVSHEIRSGQVETTVLNYVEEKNIDMLMMGAYGHSRIRQFLLGSLTTAMLNHTHKPLLILR